jgi:hypothetical protein
MGHVKCTDDHVENLHKAAIQASGGSESNYCFDSQLGRLQASYGAAWNQALSEFYSNLKGWPCSRYELVREAGTLSVAVARLECARNLSARGFGRDDPPYVVFTDPSQSVEAYVRQNLLRRGCVDGYSRIGIPLGILNLANVLANAYCHTQGDRIPTLDELRDRGRSEDTALGMLNTMLAWFDQRSLKSPFEAAWRFVDRFYGTKEFVGYYLGMPEGDPARYLTCSQEQHLNCETIYESIVTFVLGHELGHTWLGHTGSVARKRVEDDYGFEYVSATAGRECEADIVGLVATIDGMAFCDGQTYRCSIEYSCVGPVLFCAAMLALSAVYLRDDDITRLWNDRLLQLVFRVRRELQRLTGAARAEDAIKALPGLVAAGHGLVLGRSHSGWEKTYECFKRNFNTLATLCT